MRKTIAIICISSIMLVGCTNKLFDKAIDQGKLAVAGKEYDKAKVSFELALEEKADEDVERMLSQIDNMLAGLKAEEDGNIEEAIKNLSLVTEEVLPSMGQEAKVIVAKLQATKEAVDDYESQVLEAEEMLKDKKYAEGKEFLIQLIEKGENKEELTLLNIKAKGLLSQVHEEVAQLEVERKEKIEQDAAKEIARQEEIEKQKREISDQELINILVQGTERLDNVSLRSTLMDSDSMTSDGYYARYKPEFDTYKKIEDYLSPYFSKAAIKSDFNKYGKEINGVTYGMLADGQISGYDGSDLLERNEEHNMMHIRVGGIWWDEYVVSEFIYAFENGKWVIDDSFF